MSKMEKSSAIISEGQYTYVNDMSKGPPEAIDIHHLTIARSSAKSYIVYIFILLSATFCVLLLLQDQSIGLLFSFLLAAFLVKVCQGKRVEKESVMIFPALGVQLETTYRSGRTVRQFVPISKILKPVLNEFVTPVTCYWSLSLIIREEEELLLVFKEFRPPIAMLVPVWKALCNAVEAIIREDSTEFEYDIILEEYQRRGSSLVTDS